MRGSALRNTCSGTQAVKSGATSVRCGTRNPASGAMHPGGTGWCPLARRHGMPGNVRYIDRAHDRRPDAASCRSEMAIRSKHAAGSTTWWRQDSCHTPTPFRALTAGTCGARGSLGTNTTTTWGTTLPTMKASKPCAPVATDAGARRSNCKGATRVR